MRHERIKVTRESGVTVHNTTVVPWEIPVLECIFDQANVASQGEFVDTGDDREYPSPEAEMERLVKVYGTDNSTGVPYAVTVYGAARVGVAQLAKAIAHAKAEDDAVPKQKRKRAPRVFSGDEMLN